jgi:hypothetical protein
MAKFIKKLRQNCEERLLPLRYLAPILKLREAELHITLLLKSCSDSGNLFPAFALVEG